MAEQKISLSNIHNFIRFVGPKINANLTELGVDFDKSSNGTLFINLDDKYRKERIFFALVKILLWCL